MSKVTDYPFDSEVGRAKAMKLLEAWWENGMDDPCRCVTTSESISGVCILCGYFISWLPIKESEEK